MFEVFINSSIGNMCVRIVLPKIFKEQSRLQTFPPYYINITTVPQLTLPQITFASFFLDTHLTKFKVNVFAIYLGQTTVYFLIPDSTFLQNGFATGKFDLI